MGLALPTVDEERLRIGAAIVVGDGDDDFVFALLGIGVSAADGSRAGSRENCGGFGRRAVAPIDGGGVRIEESDVLEQAKRRRTTDGRQIERFAFFDFLIERDDEHRPHIVDVHCPRSATRSVCVAVGDRELDGVVGVVERLELER